MPEGFLNESEELFGEEDYCAYDFELYGTKNPCSCTPKERQACWENV